MNLARSRGWVRSQWNGTRDCMRKEQRTDETNDWDPFKPKRLLQTTALRLARTSKTFAFDVRKWSTAEAKELMEHVLKKQKTELFF
jgi:hypothetical protein